MEKLDLETMALDDLWSLHDQITIVLSKRISAEKRQLENRLAQLDRGRIMQKSALVDRKSPRRHYPKVFPKYQNPTVPSETWTGRGRQPRWLVLALKAGGTIEDFKIPAPQQGKMRGLR
jgi:DNA-binding protein H-NS